MKKKKATPRPKFENTRKALRKQKRQEKKVHRKEHYLKKKTLSEQPQYTPGKFVKRPADFQESDKTIKKKKPKLEMPLINIVTKEREKERNATERLKQEMEEQRRKIFLQANEEEDKIIKKLEKQLGLNKSKNKNNYFADDGLDYLLEICDRSTTEQIVAAEKHLANVEADSDFEEDLAVVTGKEVEKSKKKDKIQKEKDDSMSEESKLESEEDDDDFSESGDELDDDDIGSEGDYYSGVDDSDGTEDELEEKPSKLQKGKTKSNEEATKKIQELETKPNNKSKEKIISEDDISKVFSDDEISHLSGDEDMDGLSGDVGNESDDGKIKEEKEKPDIWEDIYGRKRDKEGNVIKEEKCTYVPPHLRNKDSTSDKDLVQLKRQIKSVLNKLAGTNLHWACTSIERLYSSNSRNSVNTALVQLWVQAAAGPSAARDRLVAEHAALVAVLHANVAEEIGAHFLQDLTTRFNDMMHQYQPVEDKQLDNLVSCLAHLYSFKIFQASLLYDILNRLLEDLSEKNIGCVLVALRVVGGVLRKEEPLALKNFIHETQTRVAKIKDEAASGSRIKYLLEVLMAVKNNNLMKIPNYDPTYMEHLKKMIKGVIRKGNYVTTLNIRLEDLLKADERGKWWVVGSAWEGNARQEEKPAVKLPVTNDQKLLELARKQRMNTDVRRSIFCVIMSAEDYMDAFEKLQHLGLKGQQEREIVHVLLACCLQEKTYNPYYAVLGQKLCDVDRKYQSNSLVGCRMDSEANGRGFEVTFVFFVNSLASVKENIVRKHTYLRILHKKLSIQYATWDKIKDIENLSKHSVTNLAQFLIHLIIGKGLPLSVLKVIQFSDLNKHTVRFMRQILLAIIMTEDLQACLEVFHRVSKPPKLHMFRESIRLFIQHFLVKNAGKKTSVLTDDEMATLRDRAMEVDKILTLHESKLKF